MLSLGLLRSKQITVRIDDLIRSRSVMPEYAKIWRVVGIKPVCGVAHVIMRNEAHTEFKMLSTEVVRRNFEHVTSTADPPGNIGRRYRLPLQWRQPPR